MNLDRLSSRLGFTLTNQDSDLRVVALLLSMIGISAGEGAIFFGYFKYALLIYVLTLLACLPGFFRSDDISKILRAFALVPVFRFVNVGMPAFVQPTLLWFPLIYGPLIPGLYLFGRHHPSVTLSVFGRPSRFVLLLPIGLTLALFFATLEYSVLQPEALIPLWTPQNLLVLSVVMLLFVGFAEELLFRGILQRTLEDGFGTIPGLLMASILFGVMHAGHTLLPEIGYAAGIGLILGLLYDWTDSLALVTIVHGAANVFLFALFPFQGPFI